MSVHRFISDSPSFYTSKPQGMPLWLLVHKQAVRHTRRMENNPLFDTVRPNEGGAIKQYRNANKRMLTKEGVDKFLDKTARIFVNSGVTLDSETLSKNLTDFLDGKPYRYNGQVMGWNEFALRCLLPAAVEDPNAVIIAFPYAPLAPSEPPALVHPSTETIGIEPRIVPSERIAVINNDVFGFIGGAIELTKTDGSKITANYYYLTDANQWFRYYPRWDSSKKEVAYDLQDWYTHETNELPIALLSGKLATQEGNEDVKYHESFLHTYFEYADEFTSSFSDNQAIRVRHSYPKIVIDEIPCPADGCNDGKIRVTGKDGKPKMKNGGGIEVKTCTTCKGKGVIRDIEPYDTLVRPKSRGMDKDSANRRTLEYVTPPTEINRQHYETTFDILERGKRSVGLDVLEQTGTESGVAKGLRLENLQDLLANIGSSFFESLSRHLYHTESLLVPRTDSRLRPTYKLPVSYKIKDAAMLREDADNALPSDRVNAALELYRVKYRGNDTLIRVYKLALMYSPLLTQNTDEIQMRILTGAYDDKDLIKRDYAVAAFMELSLTDNFMTMTTKAAFEFADKFIEPFLPELSTPIVLDGGGDGSGGG